MGLGTANLFEPGAVVQLNSGGPPMTVLHYERVPTGEDQVVCEWTDRGTSTTSYFPEASLCRFGSLAIGGRLADSVFEKPLRGKAEITPQQAVTVLLEYLGLDPKEAGLLETPRRVLGFLDEFRNETDLIDLLKQFDYEDDSRYGTGAMVVQQHIPFRGLCEHHLLPFHGEAIIGYVPNDTVIGLSKLTRLVQAAGTLRPSTQEFVTNKVADALSKGLGAQGVMVITAATHTCMAVRGVNAPGVITKVSAIRGLYIHSAAARGELLSLVQQG